MPDKDKRAAAHRVIRELFNGVFETSSRELPGESAQRLVIKWARGQQRKVQDPRDKGTAFD